MGVDPMVSRHEIGSGGLVSIVSYSRPSLMIRDYEPLDGTFCKHRPGQMLAVEMRPSQAVPAYNTDTSTYHRSYPRHHAARAALPDLLSIVNMEL